MTERYTDLTCGECPSDEPLIAPDGVWGMIAECRNCGARWAMGYEESVYEDGEESGWFFREERMPNAETPEEKP